MKNIISICLISLLILAVPNRSNAQADELAQLALNIEKLAQFKQILSDMKKYYEIIGSGYQTIKNLSEGNFNLHQTFLDNMLKVSPAVSKYKKVTAIVSFQLQLVKEYKAALSRFRGNNLFSIGELTYIGSVYNNLLQQSMRNLDNLTLVLTAGSLRMTDDERLQAIDKIYADMEDKLVFLRQFNNNASVLVVQREKEKKDVGTLRGLAGFKH